MLEVSKLQIITHGERYSLVEQVQELCAAGCDWIQLRAKNLSSRDLYNQALILREITQLAGAKLIINDSVDVCVGVKADGVHLGANDLHPQIARNILGANKVIGFTVNSVENAHQAVAFRKAIDYVGVGPFKMTATKENLSDLLSAETLREILSVLGEIPAVLIGGIEVSDLPLIFRDYHPHGVAVASAVVCADSISVHYKEFADVLQGYTPKKENKHA